MGLLPQLLLGALIVAAFAATMQQRLAIASRADVLQARQLAYLMRTHHQAAVKLKLATPSLDTLTDAPPGPMINDFRFLSCITGKVVVTSMYEISGPEIIPVLAYGTDQANAVVAELIRQSVLAPELGRVGKTPWSTGYDGAPSALMTPVAGIGTANGTTVRTAAGPIPLPNPCSQAPLGAPTMVTQVLP
jgi:hypothetical protein